MLVELGVVIGQDCKNVSAAEAMKHVAGYVLALDMTARCVQGQAKKQVRIVRHAAKESVEADNRATGPPVVRGQGV